MSKAIIEKLRLAAAGENPQAIIRLPSGWVLLADVQPLEGYCILFADPVVEDFNALDEKSRMQYALDMSRVGDALKKTLGAYRINYETWGNLDPALHTHIVPRYRTEPDDKRVLPSRQAYDYKTARPFSFEKDRALIAKLREELGSFTESK